jgi:hypothetical protein
MRCEVSTVTNSNRATVQPATRRRDWAIIAVLVLLASTVGVAGCKSLPGADGEYATHDRGALNRGP